MGYKPGEALGRRYDASASGSEAGGSGASTPRAGGGLGFAKASFAPIGSSSASSPAVQDETEPGGPTLPQRGGIGSGPTGAAKTEPIRFEMRTGEATSLSPLQRRH